MTSKKLLLFIGAAALTYYLFKRRSVQGDRDEAGILKRFIDRVSDNTLKDPEQVSGNILSKPVMSSSL